MVDEKGLVASGQYGMGEAVEHALMKNDYGRLTADDKVALYKRVCESLGLNPYTQPFGFYKQRDGSEKMYAQRNCADQLRSIHGVSLVEMREEFKDDIFSVIVTMQAKDGRRDIDRGDVFVAGLKGIDLANARMRAMTKAKRRCTLSLCGLGWLDESEVQDTPQIKTSVAPEPSDKSSTSALAIKLAGKSVAANFNKSVDAELQQRLDPNLRDHLRDAFARKVKASGLPPKSVAKSISDEFGVTDLVNLDVEMASRVLEWLNKEGV